MESVWDDSEWEELSCQEAGHWNDWKGVVEDATQGMAQTIAWGLMGSMCSMKVKNDCIDSNWHAERQWAAADAQPYGEPIKPFASNIIERLKARRSKGIKWSEDEALADAERMPWHFDESSSDETSSSDDDKDEPPAKKKRVVQLHED